MTGFVLLRVRAHRLLLTAALLTVVLTTCVLAALTAYAGAIGDAALRRTLQHQAADRSTLDVQASMSGQDRAALDKAVRTKLGGAFGGLPSAVAASTRSGPYGLPFALRPAGVPKSAEPDLTLLATFDRARLTLVRGGWPAPAAKGADVVQVAVPEAAATALRVAAGQAVTLTDRVSGAPLRIRVTGVYRPADRTSPYWQLDPLAGRGVHTVAFTTYGPLLADPGTFASGRVAVDEMSWQATGDFRTATADRLDGIERAAKATTADLGKSDQSTAAVQATTGLPDLLDGLRRSLVVTRSTLLIGTLQLVILAGFALLLVAQMLAEERAGETALLRARGGSRSRVARLAAGEALLLALPAVVVAPLLAGPVVRLMAGTGAMGRTGVSLGGGSTGTAWLVAAVAALACAFAVIVPALRSAGPIRPGRRGALPGPLQAGADVALLAVAGVAYWQLQRRASGSGALSSDRSGGLGVDPVLVAAPALCLLAGTVLVLRLLPYAARLGERRAARGRGLALALAGWQLARRPRHGSGAALLLVLAVAMGMFSIGQGASWSRSQRDQADFAVGADLRVTGMTTPSFAQSGIFSSNPAIATAAPAARQSLALPNDRHATALVIDTAKAAKTMRIRPDLTDGRPLPGLLAPLHQGGGAAGASGGSNRAGGAAADGSGAAEGSDAAGTPARAAASDSPGFGVPADARQVEFTATLTATGGTPAADQPDHVSATLLDGNGVPYSFALGDLPPDGRPHTLTLDLAAATGGAVGGAPAGPLRMVRVDTAYDVPGRQESRTLTLGGARVVAPDGGSSPLSPAAAGAWTAGATFDDPALGDIPGTVGPAADAPGTGGGALLSFGYRTGSLSGSADQYQETTATVRAGVRTPPPPVPAALVTDSYLRAVGAKVGDTVRLELSGVTTSVRISAAVHALPGTGGSDASADAGAVLLDLRAVDRVLEAADALPMQPTEWWVAATPGATAKAAAVLRARTDVDTVLVRDEAAADLRADPLGAGPQSALPAAVVAGAVLAAVGFAVSAMGAVRERSTEFAVLRALGAPRRKLARMLAAEQAVLVVVALAVGVALGALLTRLITPLIVLTAQAARPFPDLVVELPAGRLAELLAALLAAPLLVLAVTALRRGDPAASLRHQAED